MKRSEPPQKIGSIVEALLAQRGYLTACREQEVVTQWPELAGETVAAVTQCSRVENGVVYVQVRTASWRQELSYLRQSLLQKIRSVCPSITTIVFY